MSEVLFKEAQAKMRKALEVVDHEMGALRTGRANTHMLDGIEVNVYGNMMPINQIATVNTPDATSIAIQPWDKNNLGPIEKAILQANIGITPSNDGKLVRLNIPPLTQETRKDMVKRAHHIAEEGRVAVRNVRRHYNDEIKKQEKDHKITEDDRDKFIERVQKLTDDSILEIDKHLKAKEDEIMKV
ncbi:ribosome recycling factor [bacterium]|nr:ribosome recycling factor [bacterium]